MQTAENPKTVRVLMWDVSSSLADTLFNVSNVVLIIGALAVFIGTYGAITMGSAKEHFAEVRISENERETRRAIADSDIAKEGAAKANERAAEANTKALEAQLALAKITAPRLIKNLDGSFVPKLGGLKPAWYLIRYPQQDDEARLCAMSLLGVLMEAQWPMPTDIPPLAPITAADNLSGSMREFVSDSASAGGLPMGGITLLARVADRSKGTPLLDALQSAIEAELGESSVVRWADPSLPEGALRIVVGPKPLKPLR